MLWNVAEVIGNDARGVNYDLGPTPVIMESA